ncbi:MAG: double-strand break repair helicase AddA [Proteobacteria bacterium SG_bin9]|nr:MAG: double-strand break repair helicase AddA [Proteobacteria bacterium SG_bin9]
MSEPRSQIPALARDAQTRSSNPATSVFVSANAGSGKTHVLVQRVVRLLLAGVPPAKILCITFTKAAAANMSQRVFAKLGEWVALGDDALDRALKESGIARSTAQIRMQARKLFANALETPGGLKVQTIHALCTRLLQQFPFEANVPARFAVLDDRDQADMMEHASLKVLLDAAAKPMSPIGRALQTAMATAADTTFREVVTEAVLSRDHLLTWIKQAGGVEAAVGELSRALAIDPDESIEEIEREIVAGPNLPRSRWAAVSDILESGNKTDRDQAERLRYALELNGSAQVEKYFTVFLTKDAEMRKVLVTREIRDNAPSIAASFEAEKARLGPLIDRRRAAFTRDRTHALLAIATAVADNYRFAKQARGAMDYSDLIEKTLRLLDNTSAGWVHYKLDRGVDHVLIDEAQDTSPQQWDIVARLISEFTTGAGAREAKRTVFAVGDEKQSIFSFQGAAPREFDARRRELEQRFREAKLEFEKISFTYSFRSGAGVLQAVESTFKPQDIYRSITTDRDGMPPHMALTDAAPSSIDLWELELPPERKDMEGWRVPFDAVSRTNPEVVLANRIQREIKAIIARGELTGVAGRRRKLTYGDVLVLVRRRGKAFDAVIKALKHAGVPVAGADRLKLTEHIAVIDLMSLGDALLLPKDDLALAVALKSPLFGLDEEQLFALAWNRKGSLRAAIEDKAKSDATFANVLRRLTACEERVQHDTPFAFYAWLLGADGGRARIMQRLGAEANDALDEFLELALGYERRAPASLQSFLAWLRAADTEIKRDMEIARDEVRVMTVHGAKGLEAPVVFLADTTVSPTETQRVNLVRIPQGNDAPSAAGLTVWAGRKADDPALVASARETMKGEMDDEYRRLLYVAMTRAADRLIVGGCLPGNRREVSPTSWYALIREGLKRSGLVEAKIETDDGSVFRYSKSDDLGAPADLFSIDRAKPPIELPDWLRTPDQPRPASRALIRPSARNDSNGTSAHALSPNQRERALQRGNLVHRLLQSLPEIPSERRRDAALRFLARNATDSDGWTDVERSTLAEQVLALMEDTRFAHVFAEGSRAEVPVVGRLPEMSDAPVSGQIDRLLIAPNQIWIVDFKTNAAAPRQLADVPQAYVRQLALYRRVLALAYPGRLIRAALLWTEIPEIMEIPTVNLDQAMASLISS